MKTKLPDTTTCLLMLHEREKLKLATMPKCKEQQRFVKSLEAEALASSGHDEVEATLRDCPVRKRK